MAKKLTSEKAKEILRDKSVHGKPLTEKQRKFFGAIAGGAKPYKAEDGGWLDRYEQGGLVLKQKTTDNYGTKPNANNSDVSLPPGFKGWAYNTKGRNYSPAWGGQFAMGGNLPGATGMMYARTINPAPSNGPYAKKTKASAQDGKSVNTNIQEKRYKDIYVPLIDKLVNSAGSDWEKMPLSNTSFIEQLFSGDVKNRNLPPIDPIIKEVQNKILSLPDSEINKLMKVRWRNISAPEALMKTPKGVSYGDMFRYINHFKKLKKQGYTLQNGGEMKYYQEGLDFKPKTISQDGSEIPVDSMGYWNPDNWGNPVIIPSTDITMEGVYEPLIGISDTGDVQYMEPGEDYTFDGEYVTEYPMAKGGISVNEADAQPIKKLDQLLNFTNYNKPTKGGWLNKYQ
jgi:hypothetical protein